MSNFVQALQRHKEANVNAYGEQASLTEGFDLMGYITKLMTTDVKTLADEISNEPLTFPCLLVQCGSATNISIVRIIFFYAIIGEHVAVRFNLGHPSY
jgi:hypothetical protein